jgi:8-oxo-dGTP pyrophosphatase MutT (NUDIX family)
VSFSLLGSRAVGRGRLMRYERMHLRTPAGGVIARDVVRHPGGVAVLPVLDDGRVLLLRQYRSAIDRPIYEVPAGVLEHDDPDHETAVHRELEEEAGVRAGRLTLLAVVHTSPGYTDEALRVFVAEGIVRVPRRPDGAEEHEAELVEMRLEEALAAVDAGEITDAKTQVALLAWDRRKA